MIKCFCFEKKAFLKGTCLKRRVIFPLLKKIKNYPVFFFDFLKKVW